MPKAGFIVARFSFLVLAASTLGVAMLAAPASGQANTCSPTTKCSFAVTDPVSPSNPTAGTSNTFTFTVKNEASPQQLGAVRISAPAGFMITGASIVSGAPGGTASSTSSFAQFVDLSLATSSTATLTVTATVSCGSGSYQWPIAGRQANNFNGSGNDFQLDPASVPNLKGTATGSCTQSPPCPSKTSCSASASSSTTGDSITVTTSKPVPQGDVVVAGIDGAGSGVSYSCPTYTSSPDVFSFAVFDASGNPQSVSLTVTVRIDKSVVGMSGHPGASSWQICYASTTGFDNNAVPGTYTSSNDPGAATIGGVPFNTGLLIGCSQTTPQNTPPCVQGQNKNMSGDVLVTFLAFGDPFGHP